MFLLRGCAWMSAPNNNTENHVVVLQELSWLLGNKLVRFSAAETLEPEPLNLENVTQKLHSMKTHPVKLTVGAYPSVLPFCSIFVPFHFYLVMTLVVPCLDNIFMALLISELAKIGAMKPIFWILVPLGRRGGFIYVWTWFVIIG